MGFREGSGKILGVSSTFIPFYSINIICNTKCKYIIIPESKTNPDLQVKYIILKIPIFLSPNETSQLTIYCEHTNDKRRVDALEFNICIIALH